MNTIIRPQYPRDKRLRMRWLPMIFLATTAFLLLSCSSGQGAELPATETATRQLALDATAEFSFGTKVGAVDDMNHGLTLEQVKVVAVKGFPTPSPTDISVSVLNHTTEPIQFANVGFGIQVFEFIAVTKEWRRVALPSTPEQKIKIIPAKLETYDFGVLNGWDFSPDDLARVTSNQIRIFVTGNGVVTKTRYGAFLDIHLQFGPMHG